MPELPEVESLALFLAEKATGLAIEGVELVAFSALKTFDPPLEALSGRNVTGCGRRGKFLLLHAEPLWLVLHLARGGWVRWNDALPPGRAKPGKGPLALRVRLDGGGGFDVTEAGTEKRLAVYVVGSPDDVEGIARLGPDPLDPAFDAPALKAALAQQGGQLKAALTTQSVVAGVGNAYSDEALHVARLSPFRPAASLSEEEAVRLHAAVTEVLADAMARSAGLPAAGLKKEKRSGMRVHGRAGEPCPVCADTVREVSFATKSLQYCPTCQTGGKILADRRLSRLLK
ncbi:MAG: Fpg/Nei family DNA glycosylase [Actinomycetota bacterium]|nr:Fpg/Nei family DNA glycosylase [Actinomycetota bacterium]MDQ3680487.1 Fpg/Nei family DNA glycosylase [Actinomycetota bacterium]